MQTAYRSEISGINRAIAQKECSFNQAIGKDICDLYSRHCAATKLLYHAAIHRLTPLSLAEFWWGASAKDDYLTNPFHKISPNDCRHLTAFYQTARAGQIPAPLVQPTAPLPIIYQDQHLIVINKPGGLLSVPGRRYALQDSVLSRLHYQLPAQPFLQAVHRLDQATSGLLVVATSAHVHSTLSQQFAQRQINKTYEAILSRPITKLQNQDCGTLALPIWSNPEDRPKQTVNFKQGKPSRTDFKILTSGQQPRVKFTPHTGRTHQLRVHAAHPKGLDSPILGDTLYGKATNKESFSQVRLHLHATSLEFAHPVSQKPLSFHSKAPF
ncbi:MAG: RluA family pseudouridine synthase [Phormidesmis sp.]